MEYLLRDIHFTLHTDHENLTRVYSTGSPKVLRWKLLIQDFNFTIEYLKGDLNIIADPLLRLCALEEYSLAEINLTLEEEVYAQINQNGQDELNTFEEASNLVTNYLNTSESDLLKLSTDKNRIPRRLYDVIQKSRVLF